MEIHRLEFNVEPIAFEFRQSVRRKIVKLLNDLGLDVLSSNISIIEVE